MRRLCRLVMVVGLAALVGSCGDTTREDELVLQFLRFEGEDIVQCDRVEPDAAEVDVIRNLCGDPPDEEAEPFTETHALAFFRNNQALDLRIDQYSIDIAESGLGVITFNGGGQVVRGKRCDADATRACAVDADCVIAGSVGSCQTTDSAVNMLLFDFTTKLLITPQAAPAGKTFSMVITVLASDLAGETRRLQIPYLARFDNFDMCACDLAQ